MVPCNVCAAPSTDVLYESAGERSLTSNGQWVAGRTLVSFCGHCGHLQTQPILALDQFYAHEYQIFSSHEDEDLLYGIVDGQRIYRIDHQITTLLAKLSLPTGARVLDYGCAKGHLLRKLLARRPDLQVHAFDVSDGYKPFWDAFIPRENQASFTPPPEWEARFDLVLSSFMLEHVPQPATTLGTMARLLSPGGTLYGIVPNVYTNAADFLVVDHLNHFSGSSLERALSLAGLSPLEIDAHSHQSAWIFSAAQRAFHTTPPLTGDTIQVWETQARELARQWREYTNRIRTLESQHAAQRKVAIYGSGFYGTLLASSLAEPAHIECFIDRDPFRQGKQVMGHPVVAPEDLPKDVSVVFVGLNPTLARAAISQVSAFQDRPVDFLFP